MVDPGTPTTPEEVAVDRPAGPDETMQAAREALEIRGAAARAALFEDVAPYGDQEAQLENAIAAMNDDLEAIAYDFVQMVEGGTEPSRREAMALGADVLDVLVSTEETMLSVLDDAQRASVREEATDPTAFVDPRVLDIVAELEPTP